MDQISLVVIDFDGTALGGHKPYGGLPDNLSRFLDKLTDEGGMWATCTTWHPYMQEEVFRISSLKTRPVRAIGRTGFSCGLYIDGRLHLDVEWDYKMTVEKEKFDNNYLPSTREFLLACPEICSLIEYFDNVFMIKYKSTREMLAKALTKNPIIRKHTYWIFPQEEKKAVIMPLYLSKGTAVRKIQKELKIPASRTLIACDGANDLSMLKKNIAKFQAAPSNACIEVKKKITENKGAIGDLPFSDGVIDAIDKLLGSSASGDK